MGYSLSERAFRYASIYLDELLESGQDSFEWEVSDARDFAYRLRQGIESAKKFGFTKYENLLDTFRFHEKGNKVIAKKRITNVVTPVGIHKKSFPEVTNLSGLVTVAIANVHLNILQFPDINLSEEDLVSLSKFCRSKNWAFSNTTKELQKVIQWPQTESESESPTN